MFLLHVEMQQQVNAKNLTQPSNMIHAHSAPNHCYSYELFTFPIKHSSVCRCSLTTSTWNNLTPPGLQRLHHKSTTRERSEVKNSSRLAICFRHMSFSVNILDIICNPKKGRDTTSHQPCKSHHNVPTNIDTFQSDLMLMLYWMGDFAANYSVANVLMSRSNFQCTSLPPGKQAKRTSTAAKSWRWRK